MSDLAQQAIAARPHGVRPESTNPASSETSRANLTILRLDCPKAYCRSELKYIKFPPRGRSIGSAYLFSSRFLSFFSFPPSHFAVEKQWMVLPRRQC